MSAGSLSEVRGNSIEYRPELDGIRALAIIAIVFHHMDYLGIHYWSGRGFLAVDAFFVLSGYLITRILFAYRAKGISLAHFYIRRVARLYPVLLASVFVMVCAQYLEAGYVDSFSALASVLYFKNFLPWGGMFGPMWSLSAEEQFYAAFPLLLWLSYGHLKRRGWLVAVTVYLAMVWYHGYRLAGPGHNFNADGVFNLVVFRPSEILVGCLIAMYREELERFIAKTSWLCCGVLLLFGVAAYRTQYPPFVALLTGVLIVLLSDQVTEQNGLCRAMQRVLGFGPLAWVGLLSYSIYVWHVPVLYFLSYHFHDRSLATPMPVFLLLLVVVGAGSFYWFEKPTMRVVAEAGKSWLLQWQRMASSVRTLVFRGAVGLVLMCVALSQTHLAIESVTWSDSNGQSGAAAEVPLLRTFSGTMNVSLKFSQPLLSENVLHIVPDDQLVSLAVNGAPIDLGRIDPTKLQDWSNGFTVDLHKELHSGANVLNMRTVNQSGEGGISVDILPTGILSTLPWIALLLAACMVFKCMADAIHVRSSLQWIGCFSLALVVWYWFRTPFSARQFDIFEGGGHLDYIRYLLTQHSLPPANGGWEYHQPPAYYLTATGFYRLGEWLPWLGWRDLLRTLSLLYWMIFLSAGLAIIQSVVRDDRQQWYGAIAFCCWPAGFIHALRVGNDVALYAWYTLGLWAACRWWLSGERRYFGWAGACSVLAMLAKASGLALVATLGVLLALRILANKDWHRKRQHESWLIGTYLVTLVFAIGLSFAPKLLAWLRGDGDWLLGGVAHSINSGLQVPNDWRHVLGFDFLTYLQQPWVSAWSDQTGRQYFWNYLLRSAISSEFDFGSAVVPLALTCGVLLLWLMLRLVLRVMRVLWQAGCSGHVMALRSLWRITPVLVSGITLLVLLLAYRHKAPYASNNDFRYIYPALLTGVVADGVLATRYKNTIGATPVPFLIGIVGVLWMLLL